MAIERSIKVRMDYNVVGVTHIDPGYGNNTDFDIVDDHDFDFELEAYLESKIQNSG